MKTRPFFLLGLIASAGALGFAYILQYAFGLEPCPLCVFQRVAMLGVALVCLLGWLHGPYVIGRRIYAAVGSLVALAGAGIAGRHVWLMHLPPEKVPSCGPSLNYLIDILPWRQVIATVLRGDASCATVEGSFLGISLPTWTLVYFVILFVAGLVGIFATGRRPSIFE